MREPGLTAKASYAAPTRGYLSMMSEAQNLVSDGIFARYGGGRVLQARPPFRNACRAAYWAAKQ